MSADEFEIQFLSPDELDLTSMEGRTARYRRAEPAASTPDGLKALAGRYESDEIGTIFGVEPQVAALMVRLEHAPGRRLEFKPVGRDTFQLSGIMLRFRRDGTGAVTGLDFSNPFFRKVEFRRLGDG